MAENKSSFLAYADWQGMFNALPDEMAGKLIKHLFSYVNDENPESDNYIITALFEPIKATLKRDLKKWDESVTEKSNNGKLGNLKRYNLDLFEQVKSGKLTIEQAENIAISRKTSLGDSSGSQPVANLAVSDSVNVSVSDSVNEKKDDDEKGKKSPSSTIYSITVFEKVEIAENEFTLLACRRSGKTIAEVKLLFDEFLKDNKAVNKIAWNSEVDAKTHFHNWIAKKKKKVGSNNFVP